MPCPTCPDNARCERLGLCQEVAKQQLPGPEPVPRAVADEVRAMFERLSALRLQFPEGSEIRSAVNAASDRVGVLASKLYAHGVKEGGDAHA